MKRDVKMKEKEGRTEKTGCPIEHRQNRAKIIGNIGILARKI